MFSPAEAGSIAPGTSERGTATSTTYPVCVVLDATRTPGAPPCLLSASRNAHGGPSAVTGRTASLYVVEVFSERPRGSMVSSTESVRQCRLQSAVANLVPSTSSVTVTNANNVSSRQDNRAVAEQS